MRVMQTLTGMYIIGEDQKQRRVMAPNESPHGGWLETAAKLAFLVVAVLLIGEPLQRVVARSVPETMVSAPERAFVLERAAAVHDAFLARGGGWSVEESVSTRRALVRFRDRLVGDEAAKDRVQEQLSAVVHAAIHERQVTVEAAQPRTMEFMHAMTRVDQLHNAFLQPVDQAGNKMWLPKPQSGWSTVAGFFGFLATLYLLFVPFALLIFLARMQTFGYSVADQLVFGWRNLAFSTVFWPFGLGEYPRDTAFALRRAQIEAEYRARTGKWGWGTELSAADYRVIEELALAPKIELQAKLDAISSVPAEALMRVRFMAYAAMVAGFLLAPLSIARAQSRAVATVESDTTSEVFRPTVEPHAFVQLRGGGPAKPFGLGPSWVWADGKPVEGVTVRAMGDLSVPMARDVVVDVKPAGSSVGARVGQFVSRMGFMAPRPDKARLLDGPGAGANITFLDIGVETYGQHGPFGWSAAVLSGSGPNTVDANDGKDGLGTVALGPFGPMRFALAFQAGEQPDGFRTRGAGNVVGEFGPVTIDLVGTHQSLAGSDSLAASGLVAWRALGWLDLASGYDHSRLANAPPDHVGRVQASVFALGEHLKLAAQYRASTETGHAGLGLVQGSF